MSINVTLLSSESEYNNLRYEFIREVEEGGHENPEVYLDSVGVLTIGVGFSLLNTITVNEVLSTGFGLSGELLRNTVLAVEGEADAVKDEYTKAESDYKAANPVDENDETAVANLKAAAAAHALGVVQATDPVARITAAYQSTGNTGDFVIPDSEALTAAGKIRNIFDLLVEGYETSLDKRLTENAENLIRAEDNYPRERLVLLSLEYNGGSNLLTSTLKSYLNGSDDNRIAAWFYIRYNLNGNSGIANRRYLESALFGLYDYDENGNPPTDATAEAIISYFTDPTNLAIMQADELKSPSRNALSNWTLSNELESLMADQTDISDVLRPISNQIITHYTDDPDISGILYGTEFDNVILGLVGLDDTRPDRIAAYQHRFDGEDKDDLLVNVKNEDAILSGGYGNDVLIGNAQADIMHGIQGDDTLIGNAGHDELYGYSGQDTLYGGIGNDILYAGSDTDFAQTDIDYLYGGEGNDELYGDAGNDILDGGTGNDQIDGGAGNDIIDGGDDNDVISGGLGQDTLYGGIGNDILYAGSDTDFAQTDIDYLYGGEGNDELYGDAGNDILDGGTGNDQIDGGAGNDIIDGGGDDDVISGGLGEDILIGGEGNDTYITDRGDRIIDLDGQGSVFSDNGSGEEGFEYTGGELVREDDSGRYYQNTETSETYHLDNDGNLNLANGAIILNFRNNDLGIRLTGGDDDNPDEPDLAPAVAADPIVLDLDGDGIETTGQTVYFDLNSDGFRTRTGFVSPDDGILSVDLNGNGIVDNGRELFGDSTVLDDGNISLHGFEALAAVDDNNDNVIDENDVIFNDLRIWQDKDGDGVSTLDEMMTMEEAGVQSINIAHELDGSIQNGNELFYTSSYTNTDGEVHDTAAVFFSADEYDSFLDIDVDISEVIKSLPQALGSGKVATLHQAMALDGSGELQALVEDFVSDEANIGNVDKLNAILFKWVGTDYITDNDTLRAVRTLERFSGSDANTFSVANLNGQLQSYRDYLNDRMVRYGFLGDFFSDDVYDSEDGVWITDDFDGHFQSYFGDLNLVDPDKAESFQELFLENELVQSDLPFYYQVELLDGTMIIKDTGDSSTLTGSDQADQIDARGGDDVIDAGKGNDTIFGRSGDDTIYDGDGDDDVSAGDGNDIIYAGAGSDSFEGGLGDDRFIFSSGFGQDEISDVNGDNDRVEFTAGFSVEDVSFEKQGYSLIVRFADSSDVLTVNFFFLQDISSIDEFEFADGTVLTAEDVWDRTPGAPSKDAETYIYGTNNDDSLIGSDNSSQTIYGNDGDDTIEGGDNNYDHLHGGAGSDTFLFGRNSGNDIVYEDKGVAGVDRIVLDAGITESDVVIQSTRNGVILSIVDSNASLTFSRLTSEPFEIEEIVFADGTIWDTQQILTLANQTTENSDYLVYDNAGYEVDGLSGNDQILSGSGNDTLTGDEGNDTLTAGEGSDILFGGNGTDYLFGGDGDDTLDGGEGLDRLEGGSGNDTYLFGFGDGHDYIEDQGSRELDGELYDELNTLKFKDGVAEDEVVFERSGVDLIVLLTASDADVTTDQITIEGWFGTTERESIREFEFANGAILTSAEVIALTEAPSEGNDYLEGTDNSDVIDALDGDDTIIGQIGDDTLSGGLGDDDLYGEEGNDTLIGGQGSDSLFGGLGENAYVYERGDGSDVIYADYNSYDTLIFGEGIEPAEIQLTQRNQTFYFTNSEGDINVRFGNGYFKFVEFADGTVWNTNDVLQKLKTSELMPDDAERTLPLLGADVEFTDTANSIDVYALEVGFGVARIYDASGDFDVLRFSGEDQENLQAYRQGTDFYITFTDSSDTVIIEGWYSTPDYPIERIEFTNGVVWEKDQVNVLADSAETLTDELSSIITLSEAGEVIGSDQSEDISGSVGDDIITGNGGNDFIKGGAGNDTYKYSVGFGQDTLDDALGENEIVFDSSITLTDLTFSRTEEHLFISMGDDQIVVKNWFVNNPNITTIRFADDSIMEVADIITAANQGSEFNDFIEGTVGDDIIDGGEGNDSLIGKEGADRYHFTGNWGADNVYEVADGSENTLSFGEDVLVENLELRREGDDLVIVDATTNNSVVVKEQFFLSERLITSLNFADGTTITLAELNAIPLEVISGSSTVYLDEHTSVVNVTSNLSFIGGSYGGTTYLIDRSSGSVIIEDLDKSSGTTDKLKITDATLTKDDIVIRYNDDFNLEIMIPSESISIILKNWARDESLIELIEFADGSSLDQADMIDLATRGTTDSEVIYGRDGDELITGLAGADTLYGNEGDDHIIGGEDNDTLNGGLGDDTYFFDIGHGNDTVLSVSGEGSDTIEFGAGISPSNIELIRDNDNLLIKTSDSDIVSVDGFFAENGSALTQILFSDNISWSLDDIKETLTTGTDQNDTLYGFDSADLITGGQGDDELFGFDGNDDLQGGQGADTLNGGGGNDIMNGGDDNDTLYGDGGNDTLYGGNDNDTLYGDDGADQLFGDAGNDHLIGGDGNDFLSGGKGDDDLSGGRGDDNYYFTQGDGHDTITDLEGELVIYISDLDPEDAVFRRQGRNLLITFAGNSEDDIITINNWFDPTTSYAFSGISIGTASAGLFYHSSTLIQQGTMEATGSDDILLGNVDDNVINGLEGDDYIQGDLGDDILHGGADNDTIYGGNGADTLTGGEGDDTLYAGLGNDSLQGGTGNDLLEGDYGNDTYQYALGDGEDIISDTQGDDQLMLLDYASDDIIFRREGNDLILLSQTEEALRQENGSVDSPSVLIRINDQFGGFADGVHEQPDTVIESITFNDNEVLDFSAILSQVLLGSELNDDIEGHGSDDVIDAGDGHDTVYAEDGNDSITGGDGNDYIDAGAADDYVDGGDGSDTILGQAGNDTLIGGSGDDILIDNMGENILSGGDGDDTLQGSGLINGGADNDNISGQGELYGDAGNDTLQGTGLLSGGVGDDTLQGSGVLSGGADNDAISGQGELYGDAGNDTITGSGTLYGGSGNDVITSESASLVEGGTGSDTLYGSFENEEYVFNLGDGNDLIIETVFQSDNVYSGSASTGDAVAFGEGIESSDLSFVRMGEDLIISHSNGSDSITVQNWFYPYSNNSDLFKINTLRFFDGSELNYVDVENRVVYIGSDDDDVMFGYADRDETIEGGAGDDYIDGGDGNDILFGGDDNDQLQGRNGDDIYDGGAGDDKYVYHNGGGHDTIQQTGGGFNGIFFDVESDQLTFSREGDDLLIVVDGDATQTVTVIGHFTGGEAAIDYVQPASGNYLTAATIANIIAGDEAGSEYDQVISGTDEAEQLLGTNDNDQVIGYAGDDQLFGFAGDDLLQGGDDNDYLSGGNGSGAGSGDDILDGGAGDDILYGEDGDDTLIGGEGNDDYYYNENNGRDTIDNSGDGVEYLFFREIAFDRLSFYRDGDDFIVQVDNDSSQEVRVVSHFLGGEYTLEYLVDGSNRVTSVSSIESLVQDYPNNDTDVVMSNEVSLETLWFGASDDQVDANSSEVNDLDLGDTASLNDQVDQLISAMASFNVSNGAGSIIAQDVNDQLQPVLVEVL